MAQKFGILFVDVFRVLRNVEIGNADFGLRRGAFYDEPPSPNALRQDEKTKNLPACTGSRLHNGAVTPTHVHAVTPRENARALHQKHATLAATRQQATFDASLPERMDERA